MLNMLKILEMANSEKSEGAKPTGPCKIRTRKPGYRKDIFFGHAVFLFFYSVLFK